jgi:hypothetical protein
MRRLPLAVLIVAALAAPSHAQVQINVGINLPGPPALAVIPEAPAYYAPGAPANVFFYGHQYWLFHGDAWYYGPGWNGPWVVVAPVHVPVPILRIPVRYYQVRPAHWKGWRHDGPPRWDGHWGRDWREAVHERQWREREEHWKRGRHDHDGPRHGKHGPKPGRGNDKHDRGKRGQDDRR